MSDAVKVGFVPFSAASRGVLVVFCDDALKFGAATRKALGTAADTVKRAAAANQFKGKSGSTLDILAPEGIKAPRLIVVGRRQGVRIEGEGFSQIRRRDRGQAQCRQRRGHHDRRTARRRDAGRCRPPTIASGIRLRAYKFDRYKTKKKDDDNGAVRAPTFRSRSATSPPRARPSRRNPMSSTA